MQREPRRIQRRYSLSFLPLPFPLLFFFFSLLPLFSSPWVKRGIPWISMLNGVRGSMKLGSASFGLPSLGTPMECGWKRRRALKKSLPLSSTFLLSPLFSPLSPDQRSGGGRRYWRGKVQRRAFQSFFAPFFWLAGSFFFFFLFLAGTKEMVGGW